MSSSATATRTPRVTVLVPVKSRTPTAASTSSNQDRGSAESTRPDTRIHILPYAAASLPAIAANSTRFIVIQPDQRHDPRGVLVNTIREIFSEMRLLMWEDPTPLEPILNGGITPSSAWNLFANQFCGPQLDFTTGDLLIGRSQAFRQVIRALDLALEQHLPLLLQGEPGTGKRQLALALHQRSSRRDQSCWTIDCSQLMIESWRMALFGDGADEPGLLNRADVGTIIFRELDLLPPRIQPQLLAWIRRHADQPRSPRLIFTTSHDLGRLVADHRMRADLFFELSGHVIGLPPLRQRQGDIDLLVDHFAQSISPAIRLDGHTPKSISKPMREILCQHHWPGNLTELRGCVVDLLLSPDCQQLSLDKLAERLTNHLPANFETVPVPAGVDTTPNTTVRLPIETAVDGVSLTATRLSLDVPLADLVVNELQRGEPEAPATDNSWSPLVDEIAAVSPVNLYARALEHFERGLLQEAMRRSGGDLSEAARLLGITSVSLKNKLRHLSVDC